MTKDLNDSNFNEILQQNNLVLVDFFAQWCLPCRHIAPIVDEISDEYAGRVIVGTVNVDSNPQTCQSLGIRNIPAILLFKNGKMVDKSVGLVDKKTLINLIEKYLN